MRSSYFHPYRAMRKRETLYLNQIKLNGKVILNTVSALIEREKIQANSGNNSKIVLNHFDNQDISFCAHMTHLVHNPEIVVNFIHTIAQCDPHHHALLPQ